jgi:MFS family permease
VFNKPLTQAIGVTQSVASDWDLKTIGWVFSLALFFLGASAAIFGKWLEHVGPRKAMLLSALCFCGGFVIASFGVRVHQIWLIYLGHGVIGGIGLGLGYISPVSTLIKWFPDRPGMATGLAIMGFGGGAMLGSPLAVLLMDRFRTTTSVGVAETFLVMGAIYFVFMMFGVFTIRIPAPGWLPAGYVPSTYAKSNKMITTANVEVDMAVKSPQFYLLFAVLMLNVTAGIGVLGQASVMIQEMFGEAAVGRDRAITAVAAGGFVGLLSLFNMAGRFFWSSLSDKLGRKKTYTIYFLLGFVLYCIVPIAGQIGNIVLFVITFAVIISMYGGGFAAIPAYLKDLYGSRNVSAIHGRLLLAWSVAAVMGPVLVNYVRDYQINVAQIAPAQAYSTTMYIMAGLLLIGAVCNSLIKPVSEKYHYKGTTAQVLPEANV